MTEDPFGLNRMVYTVRNKVEEAIYDIARYDTI